MKDMGKRILAIAVIAIIFLCVILTMIFAFIGSEKFMVMLMITLLMPILLWICLFFYKQAKDRSNET